MLKSLKPPAHILDLGTPNELSQIMAEKGFKVTNTQGEDLDEDLQFVQSIHADCTTAFEILEHLINPLGVLKSIKSQRLFATVPLRLWFARSYRNKNDTWDQHYHEFEDWQFDWLLQKAGWKIVRREKWTSPVVKIGIRPLLRLFYNRYYAVEAIRNNPSENS